MERVEEIEEGFTEKGSNGRSNDVWRGLRGCVNLLITSQ